MTEQAVPVSAMQRLWLKEMGVGRWLLPEPPRPVAPAVNAGIPVAPETVGRLRPEADPASPRGAVSDALAALAAGRDTQTGGARPQPAAAQPKAPLHEVSRQGAAGKPAAAPPGRAMGAALRELAPTEAAAPAAAVLRGPLAPDMAGLREQVLACTACDLCQTRRQAVFGDGAFPARWMVIGEAPGEQEDRQGSPFVGRAGQLLDAMLAAVNLQRGREVFIANVIKCRPPANRNPRPEEIAACSPYLMKQIELIQPEGILVLGRFAAHTLLQTEASIGNLRGRVHTWRDGKGREIPLVVSYHPAYLLRSPHAKAAAWQDLRLAAALAQPA